MYSTMDWSNLQYRLVCSLRLNPHFSNLVLGFLFSSVSVFVGFKFSGDLVTVLVMFLVLVGSYVGVGQVLNIGWLSFISRLFPFAFLFISLTYLPLSNLQTPASPST